MASSQGSQGSLCHLAYVSIATGTLTRWLWMCSLCWILQPSRWSGSLFTSCWHTKNKSTARARFHAFLATKHQVRFSCWPRMYICDSWDSVRYRSWTKMVLLELNHLFVELLHLSVQCVSSFVYTCVCSSSTTTTSPSSGARAGPRAPSPQQLHEGDRDHIQEQCEGT